MIYVDIDGFKTVNDTNGHDAGDAVLREIAARLGGAVRAADTVARLGGDEFAILIDSRDRPLEEAGTVADRVLVTLAEPIEVGGNRFVLSAFDRDRDRDREPAQS